MKSLEMKSSRPRPKSFETETETRPRRDRDETWDLRDRDRDSKKTGLETRLKTETKSRDSITASYVSNLCRLHLDQGCRVKGKISDFNGF